MRKLRHWSNRAGCLLLLLVWLVVMFVPLGAFVIARNGQIQIGADDASHLRVFLVIEDEADGLGLDFTRARDGGRCLESRVAYFLWRGEGESARYCQCYDEAGNVTGSLTCPP